jgi:hypothetical protein
MLSAQLIPLGTFSSAPLRMRGVMELMSWYTLQRDRGWAGFVHTKLANGWEDDVARCNLQLVKGGVMLKLI